MFVTSKSGPVPSRLWMLGSHQSLKHLTAAMTTNTSTTSQWYSCHRMIVHQSTDITYVWSACSVSIPFSRDSIASRAQLRLRRFLRAKVVWRAQHRRTRLLWAEVSGRTLLRHSARIETWETQGGFLVKSDEWRILDEKPINVNPGFTVYTLWLEFSAFSQSCEASLPVANKKSDKSDPEIGTGIAAEIKDNASLWTLLVGRDS